MALGSLVDHRFRRLSFRAALLACAVTTPAVAEPTASAVPEQVELHFNGAAGCPTQATFVHEVAARVRRPIEWVAASSATRITVTVTQADGHASGTLQVVSSSAAEPTRRDFVASSCAEISSALALVTALTLDPNARTEALPAIEPAPATPEPEPAPAEPEPTAARAPRPKPAPASRPAPPPSAPSSEAPQRYVAWLGPAAGVDAGYAPEPLVTLGVSLGARATVKRGFSPSLQLTPLWGKTGATGPSAPNGSFAWAMARLEACPTSLRLTGWLSFDPCLTGELGRLDATAKGSDAITPVSVNRWWAAGGVALALHVSRGQFFARLEGHGIFPATRDTFVVRNPDQRLHRAAAFASGASLALGIQLGR